MNKNFDLYFPAFNYSFPMIYVEGTNNSPYLFGETDKVAINVNGFYISKYPVTQKLWELIMGRNPSVTKEDERPVDHVSFSDITKEGGFLDKLNSYIEEQGNLKTNIRCRLPSETE